MGAVLREWRVPIRDLGAPVGDLMVEARDGLEDVLARAGWVLVVPASIRPGRDGSFLAVRALVVRRARSRHWEHIAAASAAARERRSLNPEDASCTTDGCWRFAPVRGELCEVCARAARYRAKRAVA